MYVGRVVRVVQLQTCTEKNLASGCKFSHFCHVVCDTVKEFAQSQLTLGCMKDTVRPNSSLHSLLQGLLLWPTCWHMISLPLCSLLFFGPSSLVYREQADTSCILSDCFLTYYNNADRDNCLYINRCACLIEAVKTLDRPTFHCM